MSAHRHCGSGRARGSQPIGVAVSFTCAVPKAVRYDHEGAPRAKHASRHACCVCSPSMTTTWLGRLSSAHTS